MDQDFVFGLNFVQFAGILLVILMLAQHMLITNPNSHRKNLRPFWKIYCAHMIGAYVIVLIVAFFASVVVWFDVNFYEQYYHFLDLDRLSAILIVALVGGIIGFLVEDLVVDPLQAPHGRLKDLWIWWFLASTFLIVLTGYFIDGRFPGVPPADAAPAVLQEFSKQLKGDLQTPVKVIAVVINFVLALTFFLWIYNALARQVTRGDGFDGKFVRSTILNPLNFRLPAQAIIIGPKWSGKTEFACSCSAAFKRLTTLTREKENKSGTRETTAIIRTAYFSEDDRRYSLVDTGGESLGDHINLPFQLRTDVLIFVIGSNALKRTGEVTSIGNWRLRTFINCCDTDALDGRRTADYLQALSLAITQSEEAKAIRKFHVRSLLLVLNLGIPRSVPRDDDAQENEEIFRDITSEHVTRLAMSIGGVFGVQHDRCVGITKDVRQDCRSAIDDHYTENLS